MKNNNCLNMSLYEQFAYASHLEVFSNNLNIIKFPRIRFAILRFKNGNNFGGIKVWIKNN